LLPGQLLLLLLLLLLLRRRSIISLGAEVTR
jgi:hypothetical protein